MKKFLASCILLAPLVAFAEESPFPSTAKRIQIVPMSAQELPAEMKKEFLAKQAEEKIKGYQETDGENARYLLNIKRSALKEIKSYKEKDYGVLDTHLKASFADIKLAFPFKGVRGVQSNEVIGYAAIGSFEKEGWNGIRELFTKSELGNCSYSYMGILAVQLAKETTEYLVNSKPSNKVIEGNQNSGFLYTINWYTDNSMNTLECANKQYDKEIMNKMVVLANKIDKQ